MRTVKWMSLVGGLVLSGGWVWYDNPLPVVTIRVNRTANDITSAVGYVESVRLFQCNGGGSYQDFAINQTLNLATPYTLTAGTGDWCAASVRWGSEVVIKKGSTWTVEYAEVATPFGLDANPADENSALTPYDVTAGTFSGGAPRLYFTMN